MKAVSSLAVPCHREATKLIARRDSGCLAYSLHAVTRKSKIMSRSGPARQMILCFCRAMASAHNDILRVACNVECPDLQQLLLSQERFNMTISVKAETDVMTLHPTFKFVTATPTSVTHTQTDN